MAAFGKEWEQSNEELAVKAQAGDAQSMERLFLQVRRLIFHDLRKYRWALTRDRAIDWDDLEQAGAEGFLYAVEKYRPEEGTKFSTVLGFGIKHKLRYLLHLGERQRAHVGSVSLDEPLSGEDEEFTRADLLIDENAKDPEEAAVDADTRERTRTEMARALDKLPGEEAAAVRLVCLDNPPPGWRDDKELVARYNKGLRKLRQDRQLLKFARACYDDFFVTVGAGTFNTTFTSAVELAAMRRERRENDARVSLKRLDELVAEDWRESDSIFY